MLCLLLPSHSTATLELEPGLHHFVLYDMPAAEEGIVPFRLSLVRGMRFAEVQGGSRAQRLGDRRLEAVVSRFVPAAWGTFEVEGPARGAPPAP